MNNKHVNICYILNFGPHYRFYLYKEIEECLDVNFYIGNSAGTPIKKFDYSQLKSFRSELKRHQVFGEWYWMSGELSLIFKPYKQYIITGEPYCITHWLLLILSIILHKETIAWTHGWYGREKGCKAIIKKAFLKMFSKIMSYNEYSTNLLKKQGFNPDKLYTIGNCLNSNEHLNIRPALSHTNIYLSHFGNKNPTLLYCGRIQKVKKLESLLDVVQILGNEHIPINLVFVGEDIDGIDISRTARERGLSEQVWMYGPCYDEAKLGELFYNSTICVSPGNVGLTAIHALSFGCPVITHDNFANQMPEFEAIVPGKTGDFYKEGDTADLAFKIKRWIHKTTKEREIIQQECFHEIDTKWNIHSEINTIKTVLDIHE